MEENTNSEPVNDAPAALNISFANKILFTLLVIVVPIASFAMIHLLEPEWQSGRFSDYLILFLYPESAAFIIPLMIYSVICYVLVLQNPDQYAGKFIIRFGVYAGIIPALQYTLILVLYFANNGMPSYQWLLMPLAWAFPFLLNKTFTWIENVLGWSRFAVASFMAACFVVLEIIFRQTIMLLLILVLFAAPFWCVLLALQMGSWLFKNHESKLTLLRGFGIFAWLAGYSAALRFNFIKMYELYAALPPVPPDCYIATAAANGHANIVGARVVELKSGKTMQLNRQLQRLKCVELVMMSAAPKMHRVVRWIYDSAGRKLAALIQTPLKADAAYFLLKPAEWIFYSIAALLIPEVKSISLKVYKP